MGQDMAMAEKGNRPGATVPGRCAMFGDDDHRMASGAGCR
jgi:hypothetical protein